MIFWIGIKKAYKGMRLNENKQRWTAYLFEKECVSLIIYYLHAPIWARTYVAPLNS